MSEDSFLARGAPYVKRLLRGLRAPPATAEELPADSLAHLCFSPHNRAPSEFDAANIDIPSRDTKTSERITET